MTTTDKVEIRVKKLNAIAFSLLTIGFVIAPLYLVDFTKLNSDDITLIIIYPAVCILMIYLMYKYYFKRILMGPIITLTKDSMTIKDDDSVHNYHWTTLKKAKVEVVSETDFQGNKASRTMLTVWTTTKNKSDEFHISDLEMNSDEIRDLINKYTERYSR